MNLRYRNIPCAEMSEQDIRDASRLFSEHYGTWSPVAGEKLAGRPVRLTEGMVRSMFVAMPDRYVAFVYDSARLIGQVFYLRRHSPWHGDRFVTFVLQLVFDREYRGHRLGLSALQSVFGFSNDDAWGLFTSNPLTVRALEDATFRSVSPELVGSHLEDGLKQVLADALPVPGWLDSFREGCVGTGFAVDHSCIDDKIRKAYPTGGFPFREMIGDHEEWLAITFGDQKPDAARMHYLADLTRTSWDVLRTAYSRMDVGNHAWAAHAEEEVGFLLEKGRVQSGDALLDLGCGIGRHVVEFARWGVRAHGVDFSENMLEKARGRAVGVSGVSFKCADVRCLDGHGEYDVVTCLYDVIGSSVDGRDDAAVVETIWRNLRPGGTAIVSVMNLELTRSLCTDEAHMFTDIASPRDFDKLVKLEPSDTMQRSGDIFDPRLLLLDPASGIVYRKEQFRGKDMLPAEYLIADRRFDADGLRTLFARFTCVGISYVQAGRWSVELAPTHPHAKEILGVFRKPA